MRYRPDKHRLPPFTMDGVLLVDKASEWTSFDVVNFLKILTQKNYIRHFPHCVSAYQQQYNCDNNILPVTAVTAVALTDSQANKLRDKLATITGQTIELTNRVDPSVMGGVRLDYHGKRLDDTVSRRLDSVRCMLQKAGTL